MENTQSLFASADAFDAFYQRNFIEQNDLNFFMADSSFSSTVENVVVHFADEAKPARLNFTFDFNYTYKNATQALVLAGSAQFDSNGLLLFFELDAESHYQLYKIFDDTIDSRYKG